MSYNVYYKNSIVGTCENLPEAEDFAAQYEAKMDEASQKKIAQCKQSLKKFEENYELLRELDMKDFDEEVFNASKEHIRELKDKLNDLEDAYEYSPSCTILEE